MLPIFSDIDECRGERDNCAAEATCTNTDGNFMCACNLGYTGNGVSCQGNMTLYSSLPAHDRSQQLQYCQCLSV